MSPISHSYCNTVLGVSEEQAAQGVIPLPIRRGHNGERDVVQSFWQPTPEEIEGIKNGHPVILEIFGHTHPPLKLGVSAIKE